MTCGRLSRTSTFPSRLVPLSLAQLTQSVPVDPVLQKSGAVSSQHRQRPGVHPRLARLESRERKVGCLVLSSTAGLSAGTPFISSIHSATLLLAGPINLPRWDHPFLLSMISV